MPLLRKDVVVRIENHFPAHEVETTKLVIKSVGASVISLSPALKFTPIEY
jgi:hypothetical protein